MNLDLFPKAFSNCLQRGITVECEAKDYYGNRIQLHVKRKGKIVDSSKQYYNNKTVGDKQKEIYITLYERELKKNKIPQTL